MNTQYIFIVETQILMMFVPITSLVCIIFALILSFIAYSHAFDIDKDLVFRLYTREEPVMFYALHYKNGPPLISDTPFNANRPTRIFVHGFRSKAKVINRYKEAYLSIGDYNFIVDKNKNPIISFTKKNLLKEIIYICL